MRDEARPKLGRYVAALVRPSWHALVVATRVQDLRFRGRVLLKDAKSRMAGGRQPGPRPGLPRPLTRAARRAVVPLVANAGIPTPDSGFRASWQVLAGRPMNKKGRGCWPLPPPWFAVYGRFFRLRLLHTPSAQTSGCAW